MQGSDEIGREPCRARATLSGFCSIHSDPKRTVAVAGSLGFDGWEEVSLEGIRLLFPHYVSHLAQSLGPLHSSLMDAWHVGYFIGKLIVLVLVLFVMWKVRRWIDRHPTQNEKWHKED